MMDELIDDKLTLKEKRGKTLPVLCVLSWISIAFSAGSLIISLINGPLTEQDIEEEKLRILEQYDESMPEAYTNVLIESLGTLDIVAENFWMITGIELVTVFVGFFAVFLMFKLRRTGFFLYIAYSIIPIILTAALFSGFKLSMLGLVVSSAITVLFVILYGAQLKRMS